MKRTKDKGTAPLEAKGYIDAIFTGDWHLRSDTPICRVDDFEKAQWKKVKAIKDLQEKHRCPVIHSGDLFNHWKPSPYLLSKTMEYLPAQFKTIYGNHDLPQHNIADQNKSGIYALLKAGMLEVLPGTHWGGDPEIETCPSITIEGRSILVWHVMTYQGKKPWPGITNTPASGLLRKFLEYDVILTGHNHKPFIEEHESHILCNPGSITRQDADQINFRPRVYAYYAEENVVRPVYLPIEPDAVSRMHIERSSERHDRIEAFISKVDGEWQAGLDFEANLDKFFDANKVRKSVKEIIYKAIES